MAEQLPANAWRTIESRSADGSPDGNVRLPERLGLDSECYTEAIDTLKTFGPVVAARGRGGSLPLAAQGQTLRGHLYGLVLQPSESGTLPVAKTSGSRQAGEAMSRGSTSLAVMIAIRRSPQIHPFPARMAPELALEALHRAPRGAVVLDPMCGSGTVLKHAVEKGHHGIGFDYDPMAVLLSRVACQTSDMEKATRAAASLVDEAQQLTDISLPWIDSDPATAKFVEYWFAPTQRLELRKLARALKDKRGPTADLLRVALSRTVITKDRGASLARDVSHSRPHRVRDTNDYDVVEGFLAAAKQIGRTLDRPMPGTASVRHGDARRIPKALTGRVDLVITSPPYLNAIDYMRGHKLSLVWFGHQTSDLRTIRSNSIGAERKPDRAREIGQMLAPRHSKLSAREQGMLERYAGDMHSFMTQVTRTLTPEGEAVVVVGDSTLHGTFIENSAIVESAAQRTGLEVIERRDRLLPASSRYLPPPAGDSGPMSKRMRSEVVFHFRRADARVASGGKL